MSLRKSPTMTPARLEANRRNAKKSTGPRTEGGKAQSRLNSLREGGRSALRHDSLLALLEAPPGKMAQVAQAIMNPEQAAHPLFVEMVTIARWADGQASMQEILELSPSRREKKNSREKIAREA